MSEQPAPHPGNTQVLDPVQHQETTSQWHGVREQMQQEEWDPHLQAHVERNITKHEIDTTLQGARKEIYYMLGDNEFQQSCVDEKIDPFDSTSPEYWRVFYLHSQRHLAKAWESGERSSLELQSLELMTATPSFLFTQERLNDRGNYNYAGGDTDRKLDKEFVSYFNGLIRQFGADFPETGAKSFENKLQSIIHIVATSPSQERSMSEKVHGLVRGAQHELAFGQILQAAGRKFEPAPVHLDTAGTDYLVQGAAGTLHVDVKASLHDISKLGSDTAYAKKHDGKIVMFSAIRDIELGDSFKIPTKIAEQKARTIDMLLTEAEFAPPTRKKH